ncbi:LANO_0F04214g1_1 [Lachancea nothofagi CBS 11611]|uniref:DNA replication licensing factor MCM2 n=1 Tax=Lachancea nothofagi CBS 11611 TaxID=1266666 RepID=A0A1G4K7I0_9SACH|nr:LANO_0F04214g1_1 [Lachancea nothofagi CBS 11611]
MDRRRRRTDDDDNSDDERVVPPSSPQGPTRGRASPLGSPEEIDFENPDGEEMAPEQDLDEMEEQLDEVDLMGDDMYRDYGSDVRRDTYEDAGVDDRDQSELDIAARRRIDSQLNERDRLLRNEAYMDDDDDDLENAAVGEMGLPMQRRRRRRQYEDDDDLLSDIDIDPLAEELTLESLSDVKASSYTEWITQPNVARTIARELKSFLLEYTDEWGRSVYGARIRTLGELNSESLEVNYRHLAESKAILALFLAKCPEEMLKIFDLVAMDATQLHYPDYVRIHSEIHVRISDFPTVLNLRELRESNLNSLVRVSGVVTRRTGVFPQLKYVKFNCLKCGAVLGPYFQDSNEEIKISFCTNCRSRGPFRTNVEKTLYRNYQRITLQEAPGTVPAGRLPRHREVILLWDLVDIAKPGGEIEVTGVYKNTYDGNLNARNGFPVFATVIEANSVKRREGGQRRGDDEEGLDTFGWTEEEEREFRKLSRDRGIIEKIISSMAPSIYGHKDIKTAVACSLFAGVAKNVNGKHSIRGDINVLLLGDPGTAKSQILKYVEKTAHRAVFATGQGASAVGLTASVRKDPITKEWTLEGGALVLADKGVCLIDEFDKMNDQDRTSIHEAMEQQNISISKAGIVTTLQARCAIIAAANPNGGRYNSALPLAQNVDLTEPILSRFDILCVVRDLVDEEKDERLARFVVDSHLRSHPLNDALGEEKDLGNTDNRIETDADEELVSARHRRLQREKQREGEISPIPQETLMKYIQYARTKVYPKLHQMDMDKVSRVYADLRRESITTGSFPITVRHLESILRIAESFAKMRLSEFVSAWDLDRAIKVTVDSFVGAQKISVRRQLQRSFAIYTLGQN